MVERSADVKAGLKVAYLVAQMAAMRVALWAARKAVQTDQRWAEKWGLSAAKTAGSRVDVMAERTVDVKAE